MRPPGATVSADVTYSYPYKGPFRNRAETFKAAACDEQIAESSAITSVT
jgi:hypothetical protein